MEQPTGNGGIGIWLSRDPMGEAGGLNLYGYVGNDPVSWMDPFGLCGATWYDNLAIGAISVAGNFFGDNYTQAGASAAVDNYKAWRGIDSDTSRVQAGGTALGNIGTLVSVAGAGMKPPIAVSGNGTIQLADGQAVLAIAKNGNIIAQEPVELMNSHRNFADQNGALNADGSLKPGFWIGTVGRNGGTIMALNSQTFYGNQAVNTGINTGGGGSCSK